MINFISIANDSAPVSNDVTRFPEGDRGIDKWFGAVLTNHPLDPTGTQDKSVWAVAPMIAGNPYQPNYCANLLGPGELAIQYTDYTSNDDPSWGWYGHGLIVNESGQTSREPRWSTDLDQLVEPNDSINILDESWLKSCFQGKLQMYLVSDNNTADYIPIYLNELLSIRAFSLEYPNSSGEMIPGGVMFAITGMSAIENFKSSPEKLYFSFSYNEFINSDFSENDPCLVTLLGGVYRSFPNALTAPSYLVGAPFGFPYIPILKIGFDKVPDPVDGTFEIYMPYISLSDEAIENKYDLSLKDTLLGIGDMVPFLYLLGLTV